MKSWHYLGFGLIFGFLFSGILLLIMLTPTGDAFTIKPRPTAGPYVVHITGEVMSPGVYELQPGVRVIDLVDAAGGFTEQANQEGINLARKIFDGDHIHVPSEFETEIPEPVGESTTGENFGFEFVNINIASQLELEALPGIGPAKAEEIITYRETQGWFTTIEDIMEVPGIGPVLFEGIKERISVE